MWGRWTCFWRPWGTGCLKKDVKECVACMSGCPSCGRMVLLVDLRCTTAASVFLQACYMMAWVSVLAEATAAGTTDPPEHLTLFVTLPMPSDDPQDTVTTTPASSSRPPSFTNTTMATRTTAKRQEEDRAALLLPSSNDVQVEFMADDQLAASQIPELLRASGGGMSKSLSSRLLHQHHQGTREVDGRSGSSSLVHPFPRRTPRPRPSNLARPVSPGVSAKENYYTSPHNARPWLLQRPPHNMTRVLGIEAECQEESMKIFVKFNGSFTGLIYSSGYAHSADCVYVSGSGRPSYTFIIQHNRCGTTNGDQNVPDAYTRQPLSVTRNTLTVQYNPLIEEVWDEHFKVTCEYDYEFRKTVTFPFMDVTVKTGDLREFTLRAPECKMEIRQGLRADGPRVEGPVRVGDPLTLVIYMTSQHENFDMVVSDCHAHNGGDKRIQLIDSFGCPIDESLITGFQGTNAGDSAHQTSVFAFMKTFRFTGSRMLYLQCDVTMCLGRCPKADPCHWRRYRRHVKGEGEGETEAEEVEEEEEDNEKKEKENKVDHNASSPANMSESLRMTLEVVRDEQVFHARRDLDTEMVCLKQGTVSALAGVVAIVLGTLLVTCGVMCLRLRRARRQEDSTIPKSAYSPSPGSHFVPPIKKRLP
ncbi:uncharacterized protein LOC135096180 isoform X2 [Scylla paramamosain]|uniref:uncharacterized protein LOC135096180 isoform X2 n=1 Tax=Scylla paramamosain TaxID=85552 RepID=UPI0030836D95